MLTFADFLVIYHRTERPKDWRHGQFAFNMLYSWRPVLADKIRTTEIDPFYRDDRLPAFWEYVIAHWDD